MALPAATASRSARVLGLDVLRSLAIAGVLVFHADLAFWGGRHGWTRTAGVWGVELFFVLSGFLIGGLLMDIVDRGSDARAWFVFLVRRWMRTVPLYLCSLAVLAPLPGAPAASVVAAYAVFGQNLAWPMVSPWFPVSWSLSIEEWFYLLFATVVLGLTAARVRGAVLAGCCLFMVLPLLARWWIDEPAALSWDSDLRRVVVLRLDAIAYGVLVCWFWRHLRAGVRRWAGPALAIAALLLAWVAMHPAEANASVFWRGAVFCVVSTAFALCFPAAMRWPSLGPVPDRAITWVSERSYGLYIAHLPIMEAGRHAIAQGWVAPRPGLLGTAVLIAVVAELCYRCVEAPFLRRRPPQFQAARTPLGVAAG